MHPGANSSSSATCPGERQGNGKEGPIHPKVLEYSSEQMGRENIAKHLSGAQKTGTRIRKVRNIWWTSL